MGEKGNQMTRRDWLSYVFAGVGLLLSYGLFTIGRSIFCTT